MLAPPGRPRDIFDAGAQRVSVGGALTWVADSTALEAAERISDEVISRAWGRGRAREWLAAGG